MLKSISNIIILTSSLFIFSVQSVKADWAQGGFVISYEVAKKRICEQAAHGTQIKAQTVQTVFNVANKFQAAHGRKVSCRVGVQGSKKKCTWSRSHVGKGRTEWVKRCKNVDLTTSEICRKPRDNAGKFRLTRKGSGTLYLRVQNCRIEKIYRGGFNRGRGRDAIIRFDIQIGASKK